MNVPPAPEPPSGWREPAIEEEHDRADDVEEAVLGPSPEENRRLAEVLERLAQPEGARVEHGGPRS